MLPGATYEVGQATLAVGETWVLYTDGITESRRADGEEYGPDRLAETGLFQRRDVGGPDRTGFHRPGGLLGHQGRRRDDRTLVVIKRIR